MSLFPPPLPCLWDCPSPTRTAKLPWSQPTKGTSATTEQLLGTLGWCLTAGPCAQGKPREFRAESYSPPRESGSCSGTPSTAVSLPCPILTRHPAWWHLVKVVAAPGLWVPAPETLIISSQSPLVRAVQCPSITVGLFSPDPAL